MNNVIMLLSFIFLLCTISLASEDSLFQYDDKGKRDPFWPLVNSAGTVTSYESSYSLSELTLEGILTGNNAQNVAMINGKILSEGEQLGQFTILEVREDSVIMENEGQKFKLQLKRGE